jgi:hypothetical protein
MHTIARLRAPKGGAKDRGTAGHLQQDRHVLAHRDAGQVLGPNPEGAQHQARIHVCICSRVRLPSRSTRSPRRTRAPKAARLFYRDYVDLSVAVAAL